MPDHPDTTELAAAIQRVRDMHNNEDGVCGWCKGPDNERTSGDYEYWPCATFRATLTAPNDPDIFQVDDAWFSHCHGGQGCTGWTGDAQRNEDRARRGYARHFEEAHMGVTPRDQPQPRREPRTWLGSLTAMDAGLLAVADPTPCGHRALLLDGRGYHVCVKAVGHDPADPWHQAADGAQWSMIETEGEQR